MKVSIPHNLAKDEIIAKMKKVFDELKSEYADDISIKEENWQDDMANFVAMAKGIKLKGALKVLENSIDFDINIPMMLKPFESQIREEFEKEFKKRILG